MDTQPNGNDLAKALAARLADTEAKNHALQEEVERKNKALEGFMAENEALKAELGGKGKTGSREETITVPSRSRNIDEFVERWKKSQERKAL